MLLVRFITQIVVLLRYRPAAEEFKEPVLKDYDSASIVEGSLQKTESVPTSYNTTSSMSKIDVPGNEWTRHVYRF